MKRRESSVLLVGVGETEGGTKTYYSRIGLVLEHRHMRMCAHACTPHTSFKTFRKHSVGTSLFLLKLKRDVLGIPHSTRRPPFFL